MLYIFDLDCGGRRPVDPREHGATKRIADGGAEAALERLRGEKHPDCYFLTCITATFRRDKLKICLEIVSIQSQREDSKEDFYN
jgi:hypothetical protein